MLRGADWSFWLPTLQQTLEAELPLSFCLKSKEASPLPCLVGGGWGLGCHLHCSDCPSLPLQTAWAPPHTARPPAPWKWS